MKKSSYVRRLLDDCLKIAVFMRISRAEKQKITDKLIERKKKEKKRKKKEPKKKENKEKE